VVLQSFHEVSQSVGDVQFSSADTRDQGSRDKNPSILGKAVGQSNQDRVPRVVRSQ
jgi:hypothetical protein